MAEDPLSSASLERCLSWWTAYDLHRSSELLASEGHRIEKDRQNAKAARANLTEQYKAWRKLPDDERLSSVVDLIREFQGNDDALQKRAQSAEVAFAQLSKNIMEAPDPSVPLTTAIDTARLNAQLKEENMNLRAEASALRVQAESATAAAASQYTAFDEVGRLRKEVQELEAELGQLSNQDISIRQLEQRLAELEGSVESQVASSLAERESALRAIFESEMEDVREAEAAAEARAAAGQAALHDAQLAREEAQAALYTVRARAEEEVAVLRSEADSASAVSERAVRQVALLTASVEEMRRKGAEAAMQADGSLMSPAASSKAAQVDALRSRAEASEDECARLTATVAAMADENRRWASLLEAQRIAQERTLSDVRMDVSSKEADLAHVRSELACRPTQGDVADLRRELALLQAVHFGVGDGTEDGHALSSGSAEDGTGSGSGGGGGTDIHGIMLRRIRHLESRAVRAEGERQGAQEAHERAKAELAGAQEALDEQRGMVAQLDALLSGRLRGQEVGVGVDEATASLQTPSSSGDALLIVLRGQRDKFRARVLELEALSQGQAGKVAESAERAAKLHSDNVRLYEKIRYLQDSTGQGGVNERNGYAETRIHMGTGMGKLRPRTAVGRGEGMEEQPFEAEYARAYKDSLLDSLQSGGGVHTTPGAPPTHASLSMSDFRVREKARTFSRLSTGEKLTVAGSKLFLENKFMRRAVLVYAACLHLLVFATLLHFGQTAHGSCALAVQAALGRPELGPGSPTQV